MVCSHLLRRFHEVYKWSVPWRGGSSTPPGFAGRVENFLRLRVRVARESAARPNNISLQLARFRERVVDTISATLGAPLTGTQRTMTPAPHRTRTHRVSQKSQKILPGPVCGVMTTGYQARCACPLGHANAPWSWSHSAYEDSCTASTGTTSHLTISKISSWILVTGRLTAATVCWYRFDNDLEVWPCPNADP
jgi:hypothetical protein